MLAKLNGSEKQIAWAKELRDKRLAEIAERRESENHTIKRWSEKPPTEKWLASIERHKNNLIELDKYEQYISTISDAVYFINHRNTNIDGELLHWQVSKKER